MMEGLDRDEVMDLVYDRAVLLALPAITVDVTEGDMRSAWAGLVCSLVLRSKPGSDTELFEREKVP